MKVVNLVSVLLVLTLASLVAAQSIVERAPSCSAKKACTSTKQYCDTAAKTCKNKVADGKSCSSNAMCTNNLCQSNKICASTKLADGQICLTNTNCANGLCQSNGLCVSTKLQNTMKCSQDSQCLSQNCRTTLATPTCGAKVALGATCRKNSNCVSGYCDLKLAKCTVQPVTSTSSRSTTMSSTQKPSTTSSSTHVSSSTSSSSTTVSSPTSSSKTSSMTSSTKTDSSASSTASSTTSSRAPESTYLPAGPGQTCTQQGGCLGAPSYVCLNSVCTQAGGLLQPCDGNDQCPGDSTLFCSPADKKCHAKTNCDPQCDPTTQGCLAYTARPAPGMSYTAYTCVSTTGGEGTTCLGEGLCKDATLKCDSATNTCKAIASSATSTTTAPAAAATTCVPSCNPSSQVCNSYEINHTKTFYCQPAGGLAQPCLADNTCTDSKLQCNAVSKTCEQKPQTDCYPACSSEQICKKDFPFFTCIAAGGQGQPPYASGSCKTGLAVNATGVCDLIPAGGTCAADSWCQNDLRCVSGKCAITGGVDQPCSAKGACNSGNYCYAGTDTCLAYGQVGDSCPGNDDTQCVAGLRCKNKTCRASGTLREPCLPDNGGCTDSALTCDSATDTCLYSEAQGLNAVCVLQDDCSSNFRCLASGASGSTLTCQGAGNATQPCLSSGGCNSGSVCISDICRKTGASGDLCSGTSPCSDGYLCTNVTDTLSSPSRRHYIPNVQRFDTLNVGPQKLAAWHPLWLGHADPTLAARKEEGSEASATSQRCVRAGIQGAACYFNGTCSASKGAVCNAQTNKCDSYLAKLGETCTKENTTDSENSTAYCDDGLRCKSVSALVRLPNGTLAAGWNSTCAAAGAINQTCLLSQKTTYNATTNVTSYLTNYTCNAGLTCSSSTSSGTCQQKTGGPCSVQAECAGGNICDKVSKTCVLAGGLNQPCSGTTCNAGLRCNNSTGTPTCLTRSNTTCEDLSQFNVSKICPECSSLCSLGADTESITCKFYSGKQYSVTLPRGINNVSLSATSGGGGNATVYSPNWTAVAWPAKSSPRVIDVRDGIAYYNDTNTTVQLVYTNTTAYLNGTNATVPLVNTTRFGGVGSTIKGYFPFQPLRVYNISVGGIGSAFRGGDNGGGFAVWDPITNSSAGGGGGRTSIVDTSNSTEIFCLGGGGGAGYLAGGGAAGKPGNGTDGFGLAGASNSTSGFNATAVGLGAGGAGCMGGTAAFAHGSGGGGGNSYPADLITPNSGIALTVNYTFVFNPQPGAVALKFSCPVSSY